MFDLFSIVVWLFYPCRCWWIGFRRIVWIFSTQPWMQTHPKSIRCNTLLAIAIKITNKRRRKDKKTSAVLRRLGKFCGYNLYKITMYNIPLKQTWIGKQTKKRHRRRKIDFTVGPWVERDQMQRTCPPVPIAAPLQPCEPGIQNEREPQLIARKFLLAKNYRVNLV